MNVQTETALRLCSDFWGEPEWIKSPKKGQNSEAIIAQWDAFLRSFSIGTVEAACIRMFNERRTKTFPTLSHLKAAFVEEKPESEDGRKSSVVADEAFENLTKKYVHEGFRGRLCFASDVRVAVDRMLNDMIADLPRDATIGKNFSDLVKIARNNGFLEKIGDYLDRITKKRPDYMPIERQNDFVEGVDFAQFSLKKLS